ncbi:MAG: glutamine synthetase family protein [Pseudomonadota bacterium]
MDQPSNTSDDAARGVTNAFEAQRWLQKRNIEDIECIIPDQAGVARGKMMPSAKFFSSDTMAMPGSIFIQTITGEYPAEDAHFKHDPTDGDIQIVPDYSTLTVVPWESDPTAQLIHDAVRRDGTPLKRAPREVLRSVVALYEARGLKPVVAPELEFYLVKPNTDSHEPIQPPIGRSGRPEAGRQSYSISALNEFDEVIDDIYDFSEAQGLEIDTLIHEEGAAQMEINLRHGDPLELADQAFLFKRTIREAALRHNMYATFMAKPMSQQPGSAMHIHQSVVDIETGQNIFSTADGEPTQAFYHFIGGHQKYLPAVMCMLAPYVNSYRRVARALVTAPINVHWGYDNRTVGLRVPDSKAQARRLENRVPSSDANPYLAIAASLAVGYLGLVEELEPEAAIEGWGRDKPFGLPRWLLDAVALFEDCDPLKDVLGESFVHTYRAIKLSEFETFMGVISPWEREHLLLQV